MSEGDHVHELYVVLAGLMESFKPGLAENADDISVTMGPDPEGSMHGTTSRYALLTLCAPALTSSLSHPTSCPLYPTSRPQAPYLLTPVTLPLASDQIRSSQSRSSYWLRSHQIRTSHSIQSGLASQSQQIVELSCCMAVDTSS